MAGTKAGGLKAAQKNISKDPNFYAKIGAKGGRISRRTKKADDDAVAAAPQSDVALAA